MNAHNKKISGKIIWVTLGVLGTSFTLSACSTMSSVFATNEKRSDGPIANPFAGYTPADSAIESGTTFKTRKGDQSYEVSFADQGSKLDQFSIPTRAAEADETVLTDDSYKNRKPAMADREIAASFPKNSLENDGERAEIENTLGVMPSTDDTPRADKSYLAGMDQVKRLYKMGRYEAALLGVEDLLIDFPTAPKLYEMRGTLLDRLGRSEIAFRSWEQALKLDPKNASLRKYLDRKRATRSLASENEEGRRTP